MPKRPTKYLALRGLMIEKEIGVEDLANEIGTGRSNLSAKLCGTVRWLWEDVLTISAILGIEPSDMEYYFPRQGEDAKKHTGGKPRLRVEKGAAS